MKTKITSVAMVLKIGTKMGNWNENGTVIVLRAFLILTPIQGASSVANIS